MGPEEEENNEEHKTNADLAHEAEMEIAKENTEAALDKLNNNN